MYYEERCSVDSTTNCKNATVIDLRSDTVTKPTKSMRQAMYDAEVGDDVYCEDPTTKKLEQQAADLLGMEAGIFVSSGTMGNLIAIMNHCDVRGSEAYCGASSHVFLHEQGGACQLAGVTLCTLENQAHGGFSLKELGEKLRKDRHHEPISKIVILENPIDGKIVPEGWVNELKLFCRANHLKLHLDGARLWNHVVASDKTAREIVEGFDSVTFCLSKGLGCPVGSILCGTSDFVERARRVRKVLGGGMRQTGVLAAAGLVSLDEVVPILKNDHSRAQLLARRIQELGSSVFKVDLSEVQTNMVFVRVEGRGISAVDFAKRLREVHEGDDCSIKCFPFADTIVRFALHYDVTDHMLMAAARKITTVVREMEDKA